MSGNENNASKDPIYKETIFQKQMGAVIQYVNIDDDEDRSFFGRAQIVPTDAQGNQGNPMPIEFRFDDSVSTVREAFAQFQDALTAEVERRQQAAREQQRNIKQASPEETKKIIDLTNQRGN